MRVAQLGPVRGAGDDVRLGVSVGRVPDESKTLLQYASRNTDAGLAILPDRKRLMDVWKRNGELQLTEQEENATDHGSYGVFAYAPEDISPLTLVFEVQNRAASAVRVTGTYLDVEASVSDLQPAIQITAGSSGECSSRPRADYDPTFAIENLGWSPAEDARLKFGFVKDKTNVAPAAFTLAKQPGTIAAKAPVSFEAELRASGVKVDILKSRAQTGGPQVPGEGRRLGLPGGDRRERIVRIALALRVARGPQRQRQRRRNAAIHVEGRQGRAIRPHLAVQRQAPARPHARRG